MNKILNWTFGACFRTLGRFLAIFIVFVLLLFIGSKLDLEIPSWLGLKVNASVLDYAPWIPGMKNCSGNNLGYNNETYGGYYQELTNGKMCYGFSSPVPVPSTSNSVSFYVNIKGTGPDYEVNTNSNNKLIYSLIDDVSVVLYWTEISNPNNWTNTRCYAKEYNKLNQNIYYQCDVLWSGWQLNAIDIYGNNKVSSEVLETYSYVGVSGIINFLRENISSGSLDNINQNQQQTNDKLDDVNQSLEDTNQSIQDTNNNIMNSDSPNVSGMTDLAGYLPPGPLDSVLNLPLSILNSLNTQLSSSCTPLSLTLPFVNLPLIIPCLNTIFNQISGLNILWQSLGLLFGALIMYQYLVYLYNWVDDVTSLHHNKARLFGAKSDSDNWGRVD